MADRSVTPSAAQSISYCGLLHDCWDDFQNVKQLGKQVTKVLAKLAVKIDTQGSESSLKESITKLKRGLENCMDAVSSNCLVNGADAFRLTEKKVHFKSDPAGNKLFDWNDENKVLYVRLLKTKLCSAAASMEALEWLDAIVLFNTPCSGETYLSELPLEQRFSTKARAPNNCNGGFEGLFSTLRRRRI